MRDRLAELQQSMATEEANDGSRESDVFIQMSSRDVAPPSSMTEFFEEVNLIRQNLDDIEKTTKNLQLIYRTVNDSTQPSEMLRTQAEDAVQTARFLAMKTKTQISGLPSKLSDPLSAHSVRILSVQESTLGLRLKREMENLYQVQQRQRDRCKAVLKRNMEVVRSSQEARDMGPLTDENLEHALEQNISLFTDNYAKDTAEIMRTLKDIQTRHEELLELEKSIAEVHQLFIEISLLVHSQGEMVDNIESHVMKTVDVAQQGRKQLEQAEQKKTSSRKMKIMCGLVSALVLVVLILVLVFFVP